MSVAALVIGIRQRRRLQQIVEQGLVDRKLVLVAADNNNFFSEMKPKYRNANVVLGQG